MLEKGEKIAPPSAVARFPKDIGYPPREYAERVFNLQQWTEMPDGGHFAALEKPEALVEDLRSFFRPTCAGLTWVSSEQNGGSLNLPSGGDLVLIV